MNPAPNAMSAALNIYVSIPVSFLGDTAKQRGGTNLQGIVRF